MENVTTFCIKTLCTGNQVRDVVVSFRDGDCLSVMECMLVCFENMLGWRLVETGGVGRDDSGLGCLFVV